MGFALRLCYRSNGFWLNDMSKRSILPGDLFILYFLFFFDIAVSLCLLCKFFLFTPIVNT